MFSYPVFPFFGEETGPVQAGQGGAQNYVAPGDNARETLLWNKRADAGASNFSKDIPRVLNGCGCQQLLGAKMKSILCLNTIQWWCIDGEGGGGGVAKSEQLLNTF
jgi:hypothetical protein